MSCLVESAPVGLWVGKRTRGGLGEKAEEGFRKDLRESFHTKRWGSKGVGVVVVGGAPVSSLQLDKDKAGMKGIVEP